jgi:hypothetical protein
MSGMPSDHPDAIERMNRFVQRMNEVDRKLTADYVAPKDAATLILVDRSGTTQRCSWASVTRATNSCRASSCFRAAESIAMTPACRWQGA